MGQGTLEQQGEWVGRAFSNQIIGTYAQVFFCLFCSTLLEVQILVPSYDNY